MAYRGKRGLKRLSRGRRHQLCALGLLCLLLVLLPTTVRGTLAYLQAGSKVENTFTIAKMSVKIDETFENNQKSDVTVKNTGDVPAYLRTALVIYWKDKDGNILSDTPAEGVTGDYTIAMGAGWTQGKDGFWYCKQSVAAGEFSPALIKNCTANNSTAGKYLCVDILTQAVQASPADAVQELWRASVAEDGTLTPKEVMTP